MSNRAGLGPDHAGYFDYDLPEGAIAQSPIEPRDAARLFVDGDPHASHCSVSDLPSLLRAGDVLVVNDTKVIPARLHLHKPTGGAVEVLLLEPTGRANEWQALVRPGKRLRVGTVLVRDGSAVLTIDDVLDDGRRIVTLVDDAVCDELGEMPLPPYITEPLQDPDRYQTVFADRPGSVAAPTAGLHLTDRLLDNLAEAGVDVVRVELKVGLGTFRPISAEVLSDHVMHRERYRIEPEAWARITAAPRVVAVGTTVVRTLEAAASSGDLSGSTELFITRGFDWNVVDLLLTNFHVPQSSLLVLVDAFVGPRWKAIYAEAIEAGYRFLSFGDAMLLARRSLGE